MWHMIETMKTIINFSPQALAQVVRYEIHILPITIIMQFNISQQINSRRKEVLHATKLFFNTTIICHPFTIPFFFFNAILQE